MFYRVYPKYPDITSNSLNSDQSDTEGAVWLGFTQCVIPSTPSKIA